jgi:hypothetical protein
MKRIRPGVHFVLMSAMPISKQESCNVISMSEDIDDFLPKPFSSQQPFDTVKKWEKKG